MDEFDRHDVLNNGKWLFTNYCLNQCDEFPFRHMKMQDSRTDVNTLEQYNSNHVAYVGARNWNKFVCRRIT